MNTAYDKQRGFTLVEIAIVLVIIGLLLGGILKGQELINSARVRNLADQSSGVQAAYYGFIDRFRQVPGDWSAAAAQTAIGQTINGGGNGNGQLDEGSWAEASAMWEQLSKAGFIQGAYAGNATTAALYTANANVAPVNAFNGELLLAFHKDFCGDNSCAAPASARLSLIIGNNIPVNIARELDVKVDDGIAGSGVLRLNQQAGPDFNAVSKPTATNCMDASGNWDITNNAQQCNLSFLY